MELTFGELNVITETLTLSLDFVNWKGFDSEARKAILHKLWNDQSLIFDISVVKDSKAEDNS